MAHAGPQVLDLLSTGGKREPSKRKVRKGTQSCWECKRRKAKCTFSVPTNTICDGCRRRGTRCVGQEFFENPSSNRQQLEDRLSRVEELTGQLAKGTSGSNLDSRSRPPYAPEPGYLHDQSPGCVSRVLARTEPQKHAPTSFNWIGQEKAPLIKPCSMTGVIAASNALRTGSNFDELANALLAAWPSQCDLELILGAPIGSSGLFHGLICMPYSRFMHQKLPSARELLQLPPSGSHPVLIARRLLTLGVFLQSFTPAATQQLAGRLSMSQRKIMSRAVETAVWLVTSNDELIGTVEGIECIMIECMYQNNAGNLRRAYLAIRRALVMAQMIGLDRGASSPLLRILEFDTRGRISPEHLWFRIVQSDRYLSLMLGLPQGSLDDGFAASKVMEDCTAMERMERILTLVAGRIMQRNRSDIHDIKTTQQLDRLLLDGANLLPPQWWLTPNLTKAGDNDAEALYETIRIMNQFAHYHLLERLHLPYLLHPSTDPTYDYNKTMAVTASRELLSRFVSFRSSQPDASSFCRGVDFLAFIASTALCLGHIDAHLQHNRQVHGDGARNESAIFSYLAHQRLGDRGMMERVLKSMELMGRASPTDLIAPRIASILQHLLDIEADVATGGIYKRDSSCEVDGEELECNAKVGDGGTVLRISIPHLGTIKFERHAITEPVLQVPTSLAEGIAVPPGPSASLFGPVVLCGSSIREEHERSQQAAAGREAVCRIDDDLGETSPERHNGSYNFHSEGSQDGQWLDPGLELEDGWALQGVDVTFFNSLFPEADDAR